MRLTIMLVLCLVAAAGMAVILWLFLRRIRKIERDLWESRKAIGMRMSAAAHPEQDAASEPES
jgi:flagellar basal body-associated protein FliL